MGGAEHSDHLENEKLYLGYSYLTVSSKIPLHSSEFLLEGIISLAKRDDFLANERRKKFDELDETEIAAIVDSELDSMVVGEGGDEYDFSKVQLGIQDMGILNYYGNREVYELTYDWIKQNQSNALPKRSLIELFANHSSAPLKRKPPKIPKEVEWGSRYDPEVKNLIPYMALLFPEDLSEASTWSNFLQTTTEIMRIYEELRALETRIPRDMVAIQWEIKCEYEFYVDDADCKIDYAARSLLRALPLLHAESRSPHNPRKVFDDYRLWAIKDTFRFAVAESLGAIDESLTSVVMNPGLRDGDLEVSCFQPQYDKLTLTGKKTFDKVAYGLLESVAKKYCLLKELTQVPYP